jgi:hypothetical protein
LKFIIAAPQYNHRSHGIRVLYLLNNLLIQCGQQSKIMVDPAPIDKDQIIIYPEIFPGNQLYAQNIIRYCMNKPGVLCGDKNYDSSELIIYYDDWIKQAAQEATTNIITEENKINIVAIEKDLFYKQEGDKRLTLIYVNHGIIDRDVPEQCVVIHYNYPSTRAETAMLLRNAARLYCYDEQSLIITEAHLCGVDVYVKAETGWRMEVVRPMPWLAPDYSIAQTKKLIALAERRFNV